MITDKDLNEEGKFVFPYKCPICGADMSPENNIENEFRGNKIVTFLRCNNKGCCYSKILSKDVLDEELNNDE